MSSPPLRPSQQTRNADRARKCPTLQAGKQSGGNSQVYLHSVTDAEAALFTESKCQEIKQKRGADVEFDLSDVQNKKIFIRDLRRHEKDIRPIDQEIGTQKSISAQAQTFWQQWVEAAFPDLDSRAYFLPPVYFNRVPTTRQSTAGQDVHEAPGQAGQSHLQAMNLSGGNNGTQSSNVQDSDTRDDAAMQRFLLCLQKMSEENREVLVGLSQLQFGQYLGEPCYAAAAAHLPVPQSLPTAKNKQGDFDVLLIHRQYGIVICEVKAFGDNVGQLNMSQQDIDKNIRSKLVRAVSQLDKAEAMLSHLVSDVTPGLRITKTIVVPNLTARQVQQAISGDPVIVQDLCRCLGTTDPADITGLCVCSDQLSDPETPWDVSSDVLGELGNWWQRRVAVSGPDSHMTCDNYKTLVARFCGPATTVTVPCTSPPRLCVKTLCQAVSLTGECYTAQINLFPEQVDLLNTAYPRLYVAGPPGTGKTVVLLLKATEWMRCGDNVYIVSTWIASRAACSMLYHLLLQIVNTQLTSVASPGHPHLLQYDFDARKHVKKAVKDLSLAAVSGSLYVIADVAVEKSDYFQTFCDKLVSQVPRLHLWAASCYHRYAPVGWHVEYLTRPLRSPPAVVREVQQDEAITKRRDVLPYGNHTDAPPVRRLDHRGRGHSGVWPGSCVSCGREVARFLHSLYVPVKFTTSTIVTTINSSRTPPCLQWRDVLVLYCFSHVSGRSRMVHCLSEAGIPVREMKDGDIDDVATARSDVVWMAKRDRVRGLERKVVVCLASGLSKHSDRLHLMSRCSSQLLIVQFDAPSMRKKKLTAGQKTLVLHEAPSQAGQSNPTAMNPSAGEKSGQPSGVQDSDVRDEAAKAEKAVRDPLLIKGTTRNPTHRKTDEGTYRRTDDADEACPHDEKEDARDVQKGESKVSADSMCYSVQYKITVDLRETTPADCPQRVMDNMSSGPDDAEFNTWEATNEDITHSPIFSKRWQHRFHFSSEGVTLKRPGSDVILQVPAGATEVSTPITVYSAICANDVYLKQKLDLPATETVVSPLAEFWAGPDVRFKKHVEVTLPTCMDPDYDVSRVHVYCINSETPDRKMIVSKLERLDELPQTADRTTPEAYFYVKENRQVHVMTTHFSGYVCTYCGLCQNIQLEVYACHMHRNGSVSVFLNAYLWDKLQIQDYSQGKPEDKSCRRVLREIFQLREVKPSELHVELVLDKEEVTNWELIPKNELKKTFVLNWGKAKCENCPEEAMKYTELGPFCPGWKLKSKRCEEKALPSSLKPHLVISHVPKEGVVIQSYTTQVLSLEVQPPTKYENCRPTVQQESMYVFNIREFNGKLCAGNKNIKHERLEYMEISDSRKDEDETSLKSMLEYHPWENPVTPAMQQHNGEDQEDTA